MSADAGEYQLIYSPRATRELTKMEKRFALQVLADLPILEKFPWPPAKVKKIRGTDLWEIKTGNYRTLFWPRENKLIIICVINRRDLDKSISRINLKSLEEWLAEFVAADE